MTTIHAEDREFGVATGARVNSSAGQSTFDHSPDATTGLTVTALSGDADPYIFRVGDHYRVSWTGPSGVVTLADAVVTRSDAMAVGGHGVMFAGRTAAGALVHVFWTPGFDTSAWYWEGRNAGKTMGFYTADRDPATLYGHVCFAAGTLIATPSGPRPVEALRPGDRVQTLDNGPRPLLWAGRRRVAGQGPAAPVLFAPGAIGNARPLRLSPQHRVLHRSPRAELLFAAPEVLVPARALTGAPGIRAAPCATVTYVHLLLEGHEVLLAEGADCESLFLGGLALRLLGPELAGAGALSGGAARMTAARPLLRASEAALLVPSRETARRPALAAC